MVNHTRPIRYLLFGLLFALIIVGLFLKSYPLLIACIVVGIIVAIVADRIENRPSEPYKENNQLHHRSH